MMGFVRYACGLLVIAQAFSAAEAQTDFTEYPASGTGWLLVFRQKTPYFEGGAWWPRGAWRLHADHPEAPLYSILDSLTGNTYKTNDRYIFKLTYPGTCTSPWLQNNVNQINHQQASCQSRQNKEYNIWSQTNSPYEDGLNNVGQRVTGYTSIDTPWTNSGWGGLGSRGASCLMNGQPAVTNWHYAVGTYAAWGCSTCFPGFYGNTAGTRANHVELFVWVNGTCGAGRYHQGGVCTDYTTCGQDEFEFIPPGLDSDRVCAPVTECLSDGQYERTPPTPFDDRDCTGWTACDEYQYEFNAPTTTTDRRCMDLTICTPAEYEMSAPTRTSDRVCVPTTPCGSDDVEVTGPTPTTDRVCQDCTLVTQVFSGGACVNAGTCQPNEYVLVPAGDGYDTVCATQTACGQGQMEMAGPNATSDRVCSSSYNCDPVLQTSNSNGVGCSDSCMECEDNMALQSACTANSDRQCIQLSQSASSGVSTPSIEASGSDINLVPASGGAVNVQGALAADSLNVQGADVIAWLQALQTEVKTLRSAALSKDLAAQVQTMQLQMEVARLKQRVAALEVLVPQNRE